MIPDNELQNLPKEDLIKIIIKERGYYKLLNTAIRHYATSLLEELKKLKDDKKKENI